MKGSRALRGYLFLNGAKSSGQASLPIWEKTDCVQRAHPLMVDEQEQLSNCRGKIYRIYEPG